ncbi:MAG: hypothetical protein LQ342_007395 [Letrouitia transgressa]|nr:MAG: hypothetical protein LQ342_007395 [Letrouitia transgressa]
MPSVACLPRVEVAAPAFVDLKEFTMLHELLLALSGHPSPLLDHDDSKLDIGPVQGFLSPSEIALLKSLSTDLGGKYKKVRDRANSISMLHDSTVCRAVSASILSVHLLQFQRKIVEIETQILNQDSQYVGAYNIVPLSSIVGAFNGWTRKLDWLWKLVWFVQPDDKTRHYQCTASRIIGYLHDAIHTGYPDIEHLSLELTRVAETAWLKQLSSWVLYGKLSHLSNTDFFVAQDDNNHRIGGYRQSCIIKEDLIPSFITPATANSVLFVGKSLQHIRERGSKSNVAIGSRVDAALLHNHLSELSSLRSPISALSFTSAVNAIRLSLSKNVLQKLLPLQDVKAILRTLRDFFLLERGEFALSLISAADECLLSRRHPSVGNFKQKSQVGFENVTIKEGELATVLSKAWSAMCSLESTHDDFVDEELDFARNLLQLSLDSGRPSLPFESYTPDNQGIKLANNIFTDLLLPTATILSIRPQPPLDFFLDQSDVLTYSHIHSYLLGIRRAHSHLSKVVLLSGLRRDHLFLRMSSSGGFQGAVQTLQRARHRSNRRTKSLRPIWAAIRSANFLLAELGAYFQTEVITRSWIEFYEWLEPTSSHGSRPTSRDSRELDRSFASSTKSDGMSRTQLDLQPELHWDPESLMTAHRRFLSSLCRSLLLDHKSFTTQLRSFLTLVDHMVALVDRLNLVHQRLDLELENDIRDTFANYGLEEDELVADLQTSCAKVDNSILGLVEILRDIDSRRTRSRCNQSRFLRDDKEFAPHLNTSLDRLLLKLDYTSPQTTASKPSEWDAV